ncbi:hypothetical protein LY90DRAFT_509533 [Neocallimastix californiae]|uniref:FLYWCH-type domain-containing protein n=1 Tax=Neocallimastix californiae TaxID=1754190 RepID=A0A1Y2CDI1_9FUNG|nr:hypothetical protein LY90DRAFT_509533 [Neocallimastix californiae]|eukprot:ORY44976.1 hypothetical protein LY90DRAFT_509533 [Neocallimastix californiae]
MEDNIKIEISETNRGNKQIIINKKHKFNFSFQRKDKLKIHRCTEYKTLNKCKSLIILNDKKEVLKYESLHNHLEKEIDVSISVAKHKIKEEIKKNSISMDIKPKHIFNAVSKEMGLICPEYKHLTNNASESYNSYLNNIFPNKPLFYKLIYILKEEENLSYNDYQRRTKGTWKKKQKIFSATDEIKILIENYKSKEINLFYNGCNRNELIKLWKDGLIDLNDIYINLK